MSAPQFTIAKGERKPGGSLSVRCLDRIADVLSNDGYVLLPSDTAYAIGVLATRRATQIDINRAQLLGAGTVMYLGHQAAATLPLQPSDYKRR